MALVLSRGSDRSIAERVAAHAARLADEGHRPAIVSPDPAETPFLAGVGVELIRLRPRIPSRVLRLRGFDDALDSAPATILRLRSRAFDVAHVFGVADAAAAAVARALGGPRVVFTCAAAPRREDLAAARLSLISVQKAFFASDAVLVSSPDVRDAVRRWLALDPDVVDVGETDRYVEIYRDCLRRSR